jgi:hypothetical protein
MERLSLRIQLALAMFASALCTPLIAAPALPDFASATFVPGAPIDHPYFPLTDNLTRIYQGEREDDGETLVERFELTVVGAGPTILGVQTTSRRDRAYEGDLLVEDTFDYYAQDMAGNVWYLGEDVTNYVYDEDDNPVESHNESAWRAGDNSALPGLIMPADLTQGYHYYQEFAPFDAALDEGMTLASDRELSLGIGDFTDVLAVLETTAVEPDARGIKYYAAGMGLIAEDEGLDLDLMNPELGLELVSTVPLPPALPLMLAALAGLVGFGRRH